MIRVNLSDGNHAVLVKFSRYTPFYCFGLGRVVSFGVMVIDQAEELVNVFDLDGEQLQLDILPLGFATDAPGEVLDYFKAAWMADYEKEN